MKNITDKDTIKQLKDKVTELEDALVKYKLSANILSESEEQLRLITENTVENIAIVTFDLKAIYLYVNPSVKTVFGYEPEDLIGKSFFEFIHPEDKKAIYPLLKKYVNLKIKRLLTGKKAAITQTIEYRFKNKKGEWRYLQSTINIAGKRLISISRDITERKIAQQEIENKSQELNKQFAVSEKQRLATLSVLADLNETAKELRIEINERKQTEKELQKYRDHLEELVKDRTTNLVKANKELESFSYSVSHDLRAPLRAIDGFTRILIEDYTSKLDKEGQRIGSVIQQNAKKMGKLIDDLLTFSRMGRTSMTVSKIDMKNMVNAIYHEMTNSEERKRIKFTIGDLPPINGDANMMHQVWTNLISNAVKFSSTKKQAVISVSFNKEVQKVIFSVQDNGVGFNMQYYEKLFGVFQRLHNENEFEGIGVGLALAKRIIERHKGEIWAKSKVGKGTTIYFSMPD